MKNAARAVQLSRTLLGLVYLLKMNKSTSLKRLVLFLNVPQVQFSILLIVCNSLFCLYFSGDNTEVSQFPC